MSEPTNTPEKKLSPEDLPRRKADYRLEQLDDELLLYHPSDTRILYLNQSASLVWGLCDGEHQVSQILQLLSDLYPEAKEIEADIYATLAQFLEHGCIEL